MDRQVKEMKDFFTVGVTGFLMSLIIVAISCFIGDFGFIFFLIGLVLLFISGLCLLVGTVEGIKLLINKNRVKNPKYKPTDNEEFIAKAKAIEEDFESKIAVQQDSQNENRTKRDELQTTLDDKNNLKKQYDSSINDFIKANTYKIKRHVTINMVNNTFTYVSKTVNLDDVTDIQVKCNSQIITQSNTSEQRKARKGLVSTVGRAAVGVALTGGNPVGAVMGLTGTKKTKGITSTTTTQKEINSYSVVVLTNAIQNSVITISCGNLESDALEVSNAINNACINSGTVDTEQHDINVNESNKLGLEIKDLQTQIKELDKENKGLTSAINMLKVERNKAIKQLKKQYK